MQQAKLKGDNKKSPYVPCRLLILIQVRHRLLSKKVPSNQYEKEEEKIRKEKHV
jgi:hypothetical protein